MKQFYLFFLLVTMLSISANAQLEVKIDSNRS